MIDIQLLRADLHGTAERLAGRGFSLDTYAFLALESRRKAAQAETEELQAKRNAQARKIGQAKGRGEDVSGLMAEASGMGDHVGVLQAKLEEIQGAQHDFLSAIPNLPHESVPNGATAEENVQVRVWGEPREFGFPVKDHVDLGEGLGIEVLSETAQGVNPAEAELIAVGVSDQTDATGLVVALGIIGARIARPIPAFTAPEGAPEVSALSHDICAACLLTMELAGHLGLNIVDAVEAKIARNASRGYHHGGKAI